MMLFDGQQYFHQIPGLLVGKAVTREAIEVEMNKFIDSAPKLIAKLLESLKNIETPDGQRDFNSHMEVLIIKLGNVYARSLESEAERLLRCAKYEHQREYVVKNLRPFIINIHELSIAMQKAQANEVQKTEERLSTIEGLDSITKTIIELGNIISEGRDGRAKTILRELIGYVPEEDGFERLLDLLRGRHWQEAIKENNRLKEKYTEKMKSLSIADLSKVILAVDDRPEILTFVKNALKDHYKVIAVPSPEKALRALEKQKPNLFLLDIDMPEMSGLELAATIRAIPAYAKTPLIFLTGNSDKDTVASAMKLKCNDFIVKPASNETLLTKVVKQFEA